MMSLVNPGIFAPTYLVILTVLFIILEQYQSTFQRMEIRILYSDPDEPEPDFDDDTGEMA